MRPIYFVGTYPPIMCGIATYTSYLTRESPQNQWHVLSFDLEKYGAPLTNGRKSKAEPVWYGISGHHDYCARDILKGMQELGHENIDDAVLWFQHEAAIWSNPRRFVAMLKQIQMPKVVTLHTLHFQSKETPSGLREYQYDLLQNMLPHVDAITVFSYGVYWAIISAFPEHCTKVFVLKHGIHSYPEISQLSKKEAKEKLYDFLLYESKLDQGNKEALHQHRIFTDPNIAVIGQTGFLCPLKKSESLYIVRKKLQKMIPHKQIAAIRIGRPREESHKTYARKLHSNLNDSNDFLLDTWLPDDMMALAQRAFDINFYWPRECTQSGIMAHALGAGAIIAGRDMEGLGETLRGAGEIVDTDLESLIDKIRKAILNPELCSKIEGNALNYAEEFSWKNQVRRHYALTESIRPAREDLSETFEMDPLIALATGNPNLNLRIAYRRLLENIQGKELENIPNQNDSKERFVRH